jgi:acyl-coenzyme A thioesterase PaaI-like protein
VRFIRGLTKDTGTVRCEAHTLHVGRSTGIAQATLVDRNGKLLGTGTTACAIFRP